MNNRVFVFLYPQEDIFDFEIETRARYFNINEDFEFEKKFDKCKTEEERDKLIKDWIGLKNRGYKKLYSDRLNQCIDQRYRRNGFSIDYAIFDNSSVSDVILLQPRDRVISVGMDAVTHRTQRDDGTFTYPDNDYILNQVGNIETLRVAGFHLWDCVQRLSRRAYERSINVLVDEELTELFGGFLDKPEFRLDVFPGINPASTMSTSMFESLIENRQDKPWMYQWQV